MKRPGWTRLAGAALLAVVTLWACDRPLTRPATAPGDVAVQSPPASDLTAYNARGGSVAFKSVPTAGVKPAGRVNLPTNPVIKNNIFLSQTVYATDYTSAGVGGLRDVGSGTISLAGVSGGVWKALLYWHGPTNTTNPDANANVYVDGSAVHGTNIGFSSDNCWGYQNSQAYVADITPLVAGKGNGNYALTGFASGAGGVNTNGASLIAFYHDALNTNNRDVVVFHGNDSNISNPYDADNWNVTLAGINYTSGNANLQLHVSDGQVWTDDAVYINGTQIVPAGSVFDGITVPHANNGPGGNGALWDIRNFDVTSFMTPGVNTLHMFTGLNSDCLSMVAALVDLPSGAAPPATVVFAPAVWSLTTSGSVGVWILGSATFDATQASPAEARFVINNVLPGAPVAMRSGVYLTSVRDYNGDGKLDRYFVFYMSDLKAAGLSTSPSTMVVMDHTGAYQYDALPATLPTVLP